MELAAELEAILREFAALAPVEVRENGGRVAPLAGLSWEVRGAAEKPLLHLLVVRRIQSDAEGSGHYRSL